MISDDHLAGSEGEAVVKKEMELQFGAKMELVKENADFSHHGWFMLTYRYIPKNYDILFEGEFKSFNIRITKADGAFMPLNGVADYAKQLNKKDVQEAVKKLKTVLEGEISFYKIINGKRYQEIDGEYKRIRR